MKPTLVVTTGYPCSGKSTVSAYLNRIFDFMVVSSDDLRKDLFNISDFLEFLRKDKRARQKENVLWNVVNTAKCEALHSGLDVIVDSCASAHISRADLLSTENLNVQKYLLYLKVKKDILMQRNKDKGRKDPITLWEKYWQEPKPSRGYTLLAYNNNTAEQLRYIFKDLEKRFKLIKRD